MQTPHRMFIEGDWADAADGATLEVVNPATEQPVASVPAAGPADVDRALTAAADGFARWRRVDAWTRSATLRRMADWVRTNAAHIGAVITEEQGKPLAQAAAEVAVAVDYLEWFADEARRIYGRIVDGHSRDHRILVNRQPIGPVAAFTPANFPLLLPVRKIAPALATGCSVVLKPAETAPRVAYLLGAAAQAADLPRGVLNVITGEPAEVSRRLVESPVIRKVTLTGSVPVGRLVAELAGRHLKTISMELGGHAPVLILDDVDPAAAAATAVAGKFRNGGQVCISASRFLVPAAAEPAFVEAFVGHASRLRLGEGTRPGVDVGPLENARRRTNTEALIDDAVARGARLAYGGHRPPELSRGFFFQPTVLRGVGPEMALMRDEPFGPIAPIMAYESVEQAIAEANATSYGLAGFVFTHDLRRAFEVSEALDVGMVGVNFLTVATAEAPFGGVKDSGMGREGGTEGIDAYTTTKYVNMAL